MRRGLLLLALALLLPGCNAVRAQVGFGVGIGAEVQVLGLAHGGVLFGGFRELGPCYGRGNYTHTRYLTFAIFHATTQSYGLDDPRPRIEHDCFGLLPGLFSVLTDEPIAEPWALEIGLALGLIELRLGVNPVAPSFLDQDPARAPQPDDPQQDWPRPADQPDPPERPAEPEPEGPGPAIEDLAQAGEAGVPATSPKGQVVRGLFLLAPDGATGFALSELRRVPAARADLLLAPGQGAALRLQGKRGAWVARALPPGASPPPGADVHAWKRERFDHLARVPEGVEWASELALDPDDPASDVVLVSSGAGVAKLLLRRDGDPGEPGAAFEFLLQPAAEGSLVAAPVMSTSDPPTLRRALRR